MTLVDSNVLLSLLHRDARERETAERDITRIKDVDFGVTSFVISEVSSFLYSAREFRALQLLLGRLRVTHVQSEQYVSVEAVLAWMQKYAPHRPDFADAHLVLLSATLARSRVWTYDTEFRTVWRRPDGSAVPMAVKA